MRARAGSLTADEVTVRSGCAAPERWHFVGVHREAHRAARLAPFEARVEKDSVEALGFRLAFHQPRTGHYQRLSNRRAPAPALKNLRSGTEIFDPAVGATADEDVLDGHVL